MKGVLLRIISLIALAILIIGHVPAYDAKAATPGTFTITSPADGATVTANGGTVNIKWSKSKGGLYYLFALLDVSTNEKLANNIKCTSESYTISVEEGHKYKACIGSVSADGKQKWCTPVYFTVAKSKKPGVPTITYPTDGMIISEGENVNLAYKKPSGALYYLVSIYDVSKNSSVVYNKKVYTTSYSIASSKLVPGNTYKCCIGAVNLYGQTWSDPIYFTVGKKSKAQTYPLTWPIHDSTIYLSTLYDCSGTYCHSNGTQGEGKIHGALDFSATVGTDVYPAADGTVCLVHKVGEVSSAMDAELKAQKSVIGAFSGFGTVIILRHNINGKTIYTQYSHLLTDSINVKVGDKVTTSDVIAKVGRSAYRENDGAAHLDFSVYSNIKYYAGIYSAYRYDPLDLISSKDLNKARIYSKGNDCDRAALQNKKNSR